MARRTRSRKLRFILIVVSLLVAGSACSSATRRDGVADAHTADADIESGIDADRLVDAEGPNDADPEDSDLPLSMCEDWEAMWEEEVTVSAPGVAAEVDAICANDVEPVESNTAARVTLNAYSADLHLASGRIELPTALQEQLVGTPTISFASTHPETLVYGDIGPLEATGPGAFTFQVTFPEEAHLYAGGGAVGVTMVVSLTLRCDEAGAVTRVVESTTHIWLCEDLGHPNWYSSGDVCPICYDIAEMAPSPIIPASVPTKTALSRALTLEVVPVASYGRTICVVAEHSGSVGPLRYRWIASSGVVHDDDQGGAVWELPEQAGPHLIQVVLQDRDSAAVASYRALHSV